MSDFPHPLDGSTAEKLGYYYGGTQGTSIVPGVNYAVGAYTEPVSYSHTLHEANGIGLDVHYAAAVNFRGMLDLAIGESGSEVNIVEDYLFQVDDEHMSRIYFPITVPQSTRLTMRVRSALETTQDLSEFYFAYTLPRGGFGQGEGFQRLVTYGSDTSTIGGVELSPPPGATNDVGTWTTVVAAADGPIEALYVQAANIFWPQGSENVQDNAWAVDVAVGAVGEESVVLPALQWKGEESPDLFTPVFGHGPFPVSIASGDRIAARYRVSVNTYSNLDVVLYALR